MLDLHRLRVKNFQIPELNGLRLNELSKYRTFQLVHILSNGETKARFINVETRDIGNIYDLDYAVLNVEKEKEMHYNSFLCSSIDHNEVELLRVSSQGIISKVILVITSFNEAKEQGVEFRIGGYYHIYLNKASEAEIERIENEQKDI